MSDKKLTIETAGKNSLPNSVNDSFEKKINTAPVPKLSTSNLMPSKSQPVAGIQKNVSEKVAKVFGSDDSEVFVNFFVLFLK